MQVVNFTEARNNLKRIFDTVYHNNEEVIVNRKNGENVAIVSLETYNAMIRGGSVANEPRLPYGSAVDFDKERQEFRRRLEEIEAGKVHPVRFEQMWDTIDREIGAD
jgi:prevent-host-death family protein